MTNADKVRNSKNMWKVINVPFPSDIMYRYQNGYIQYMSNHSGNWINTTDNYALNSLEIEEIIPKKHKLTNADKVRNSKNEWKVVNTYCIKHAQRYRCLDGIHIEYIHTDNNNWKFSISDTTINYYQIEEIIPETMTNADKVRNSKNEWKVMNGSSYDVQKYRCLDGIHIEYLLPRCVNWYVTNSIGALNSFVIEEIIPEKILSPLEQMIANPKTIYETYNPNLGFFQYWRWDNNRTFHGFFENNCWVWHECLTSTFEKASMSNFKKYDDLETRLKNVKLPLGYRLDQHILSSTNYKLCGLCLNNYSLKDCDEYIEFWQTVKLLCQEIEKKV